MGIARPARRGLRRRSMSATHTYSHTKLVASFAGFAPVSNPAISVAVVIDTPTVGASKYGGAVSAPVFAEGGAAGAGVSWRAARPAAEDEERDAGGAEGDGRRCSFGEHGGLECDV